MFARYAFAPNRLGYCGPPDAAALAGGAALDDTTGPDVAAGVRAAARHFSGAWPYLQVLSRLTGIADPLDHRLVEAYWLGAELLAVIGPQAGSYWTHLTPDLLAEAAGDHCFHVFGVYPWTRLLNRSGGGHALHVLDSCRIRWGTVLSRAGAEIEVSSRRLSWDGVRLGLAPPTVETVPVAVDGLSFLPDVAPGDRVALHWSWLTDRLTAEHADELARSTQHRLTVTNRRLARERP